MTAEPQVSVPCLSLVLPASPASVGEARRRVLAFAAEHGADGAALAWIALAVSEATANAVVHGYTGARGPVYIHADVEDGELQLVVADEGRGFSGEPAPGLGLGLALVCTAANDFEVRDRPAGGVEVWAAFRLGR